MSSAEKTKRLDLSSDEKTLLAMYREVTIEREDYFGVLQGDTVEIDDTLRARVRLGYYRSGMFTIVLDLIE